VGGGGGGGGQNDYKLKKKDYCMNNQLLSASEAQTLNVEVIKCCHTLEGAVICEQTKMLHS
jgi:hypothetical protein